MKRRKITICIIILLILAIAFLLIDIYVGKLVDLHPPQ